MRARPTDRRSSATRHRRTLFWSALLTLTILPLSQFRHDAIPLTGTIARFPSSEIIDSVCAKYLLLPRAMMEELLKRLEMSGGDPTDIQRFGDLLRELAENPRLVGLDQWIHFVVVNHKQGVDLLNTFEELVEARHQLELLRDSEVLEVGADDSQEDAPGRKSFDLMVRTQAGGRILRAIEVTTVQDPILRGQDIRSAVQHGAEKSRKDPRAATAESREVSIALTLGCMKPPPGALAVSCPSPGVTQITFPAYPDGRVHVVTYDLLQDGIPAYLNAYRLPNTLPLEVVTLTDRDSGSVLAVYRRKTHVAGTVKWDRVF